MTLTDAQKQSFLKQAAQDYDLPLWKVEEIYRKYPDNFHNELESTIRENVNWEDD